MGKQCRKCGEVKQVEDFPRHPMMADGHLHACKECIKAYKAQHYQAKREAIKARTRDNYHAKADEINAGKRERYRTDPAVREKIRQGHKKYAARFPEKVRVAARRAYRRRMSESPEYFTEQQRRMRAKAKGLTELTLTLDEWREMLAKYEYRCAYCGSNRDITMDHQVPIQRGGKHDKENVVPACRACNASKYDLTVAEWIAAGGFGRRTRKGRG